MKATEMIAALEALVSGGEDFNVRFEMRETSDEKFGDSHPANVISAIHDDEDLDKAYFLITSEPIEY